MKCTTKGKYSDIKGTVVFPDCKALARTDENFRSGTYGQYHHGPTPLTDIIGLDMIRDFPGDELHHLDLGVTKLLITGWKKRKLTDSLGWSTKERDAISIYLKSTKIPREIHRIIRGIDELSHWKGTEYRTFLLYVSIVLLKKYLPLKYYQHFLLYFCSVTICSANYHMKDLLETANSMLVNFLDNFKILYGSHHFTCNIHNLCHLIDDVRRFGPLINFSSYPFESKLHDIKMNIRSGHLPLAQIGKRMIEQEYLFIQNANKQHSKHELLKKKIINFELDVEFGLKSFSVYGEIQLDDYIIDTTSPNKYFLSTSLQVIETKYVVQDESNNQIYLYGSQLENLVDLFDIPFESRALHIYLAEYKLRPPKLYSIRDIKAKMFVLRYIGDYAIDCDDEEEENFSSENKLVFIPLIHTLK